MHMASHYAPLPGEAFGLGFRIAESIQSGPSGSAGAGTVQR